MGAVAVARFLHRIERYIATEGHNHDVTHVWAPCSAQMGVGKASDDVVVFMVARTVFPAVDARVWTRLHHSEWSGRTRIGVSSECRSDKRIDKLCQVDFVSRIRATCESQEHCRCRQAESRLVHYVRYSFYLGNYIGFDPE